MKLLSHLLTIGLCFAASVTLSLAEKPLNIDLPTENRYLFSSEPQKFYMYVPRNFEGKVSSPWTAGQYGYVRTLVRTDEGVIATKFHEGIDIRPMERDSAGRPLDLIKSIAKGKVVYTSPVAGNSNYGRYVVVEHNWGSGAFYTIYAHLDSISCEVGQPVDTGSVIAKMGYTGAGINRTRAHLHLELNVMTNSEYPDWHAHNFGSSNVHGLYNGLNMNGLNIAELFIRESKNPAMTITEFIAKIPVYFKVTVPRREAIDLAARYPWIRKGDHSIDTPSWEISFASSGFPLAVTPSFREVSGPVISYVKPTKSNHKYYTKNLLYGSGRSASLTKLGLRTVALFAGDFPRIPRAEIVE